MHETIVKELLNGETLKRAGIFGRDVHLPDLIDDEGIEYMLTATEAATLAHGDLTALMDLQTAFAGKCRSLCENWLDSANGQEYLNQRIRDYEEGMKEEAAEARREAKRENAEAA